MVAKIIKGGNFGELVNYVTQEMKNARLRRHLYSIAREYHLQFLFSGSHESPG